MIFWEKISFADADFRFAQRVYQVPKIINWGWNDECDLLVIPEGVVADLLNTRNIKNHIRGHMEVSIKGITPKWILRENPMKMDDLGVPP